VNLTFNGSVFVVPGAVTVIATVVTISNGPSASVTLTVPVGHVSVSTTKGPPVAVTGPGIEAVPFILGQWPLVAIALAPTAALILAILVRRWWKTRRWSRR
jgi:alpha-D-ribose 1-methylphosphonate 5-triphosphate synthase subunit PhnH